ncbi:MAG: hypothetical protein AB7F79_13190 [Steroidobacteraceae bacterium]
MSVVTTHPLCVDSLHPALPGHFPDMPVVPGVVMLSEVIVVFHQQFTAWQVTGIKKMKFLKMLFPGQVFTVDFAQPELHSVRFKCWHQGELLAEGNLVLQAEQAV